MPYSVRGNQPGCNGWAVVNTATGKTITCHPTKKKAVAHLRALYKNIGQDLALTLNMPDVTQMTPGATMSIGASSGPAAVEGMDRAGLDEALDAIAAAAPNPDKNRGNAETLRRYWAEGPGAAKIRWGQPGDFERCRTELVDDAKFTPEQAAGYCNLLHHRALGFYPATHKKMEHAGSPAAAFNEAAHPRAPAGSPAGGQFAPASTTAAPTNEKPVGEGETGQRVSDLQARLNALGAKLKVDGKFGPATLAAVKAFQKAHGLKTDGLVGPLTTAALRGKPAGGKTRKPPVKTTPKAAAAGPEPSGLPSLVTIPGVDILAAGTWQLSSGRQTFTRADLEAAVQAAACPAVGPPLIKIGHLDDRFTPDPSHDGEPAIGKVTNLRLDGSGNKLLGDMAGMPGWLGAIAASAFPRRSVEGRYNFTCQIGHAHPFVLTGVALLGVTPPGVGVLSGLADIASLYGLSASAPAEAWHTPPADQEGTVMPVTEEDVRRAYYATAGAPQTWWITELQMAPAQLIVADEDTGKTYRVPFSIEADAVQFGSPAEIASYADIAAARGTGPVAVFATAAESRSVMAAWDGNAAVKAMGDDPSPGAIKAMFAIPGDTKTDSSLPHHDCTGGKVGAANPDGCSAAIAALNGARGGLKGISPGQKKTAYNHLAAHLTAAGRTPPEFKGSAGEDTDPEMFVEAAGNHGPHTGEHDHPHSAYGQQGGDQTHDHNHRHNNDAVHNHVHDPVSAAPAAASQEGDSEVEFTADQLSAIRARLGKKDDEEVTAADIAAMAAAPVLGKDSVAASAPLPAPDPDNGMYLVYASIIDDLRKRADAADAFAAELRRHDRDEVLASAVRDGKFPQSRLEHYRTMWNADPDGTREHVNCLASGLVPVGGPVGAPGLDPDLPGDFEDQQAYRRLYPGDMARRG